MKYSFIFVIFIFVLIQNSIINCQCPGGYTYIPGSGCKAPGTSITTYFCSNEGQKAFSQGGSISCSGNVLTQNTFQITSNQITWASCQSSNLELIWYEQIGNCNAGDTLRSLGSVTSTLSSTNRYFVVTLCQGMASYNYYTEANSVASYSQATIDSCTQMAGLKTLHFVYDYGASLVCPLGYSDSLPCTDINECFQGTSGCQSGCVNTDGGYYCTCPGGYSLAADQKTCADNNECATAGICGSATCNNVAGTYQCLCPSGYTYNSGTKACDDNNECATAGICGSATCNNIAGSYQCLCPTGYSYNSGTKACNDNNECATTGICGSATCNNLPGTYECKCTSGYNYNSGTKACDDINECSTAGVCGTAKCNNLPGDYKCFCDSGYKLGSDNKSCENINECDSDNGGCSGGCVDQIGGVPGFYCTCSKGYQLGGDGKSCDDINECQTGENDCTGLSVCKNENGKYTCSCSEGYHSILNGTDCEEDSTAPSITSISQKQSTFYTFIINGKNFLSNPTVKIGSINCIVNSSTGNQIECQTKKGLEIFGEVIVTATSGISKPFTYSGAPFIVGIKESPSTQGGDVTISGRNFPVTGTISLTINSIDCPIKSKQIDQIICTISEGTGINNNIKLSNELVSNTDDTNLSYANPKITSASVVYSTGGILTLQGDNFGNDQSKVTISIGSNQCKNIVIISHTELTCELKSSNQIFTQIINLIDDGLQVENSYYFTYSVLESGNCENDCYGHGTCGSFGCDCNDGFAGVLCNETSVILDPSTPTKDKPIVDIGNGNDFAYQVSIIRIEEIDFKENVVLSYPLLSKPWLLSTPITNKWVYNITLPNESELESTFEYFIQSRNVSFANTSFIVPSETLKLSFKTGQWKFTSRLNTLRIVVQTQTVLSESSKECSINQATPYNFNQHLWTTTENPESGLVSRFIKYAQIDNNQIIANIKQLETNVSSSIVGIEIPYFENIAIIDPDFSVLLNVDNDNKQMGNCDQTKKTSANWRVATGATIGAVGGVAIAGSAVYFIRRSMSHKKLLNLFKSK